MKLYKTIIGLALTLIFFLFIALFNTNGSYLIKERVLDYVLEDLDGDNQNELILLTKSIFGKYGKDVVIFSLDGEIEEIYRENFSDLKPWKITTGDIDGDGFAEVSIGVYKEAIFHQIMAKRPFIYSFKDNELHPKWKGSRLSRPFTNYTFYDLDGDGLDEIISIEELENGDKLINSYKWKGFGFESIFQGLSYDDINDIYSDSSGVYITVKEKDGTSFNGRIIIKENLLNIERLSLE